jgi:hypothetical protein
MGSPKDGCTKLDPPPYGNPDDPVYYTLNGSRGHPIPFGLYTLRYDVSDPKKLAWIVMISRYGGCTFEDKVTVLLK